MLIFFSKDKHGGITCMAEFAPTRAFNYKLCELSSGGRSVRLNHLCDEIQPLGLARNFFIPRSDFRETPNWVLAGFHPPFCMWNRSRHFYSFSPREKTKLSCNIQLNHYLAQCVTFDLYSLVNANGMIITLLLFCSSTSHFDTKWYLETSENFIRDWT